MFSVRPNNQPAPSTFTFIPVPQAVTSQAQSVPTTMNLSQQTSNSALGSAGIGNFTSTTAVPAPPLLYPTPLQYQPLVRPPQTNNVINPIFPMNGFQAIPNLQNLPQVSSIPVVNPTPGPTVFTNSSNMNVIHSKTPSVFIDGTTGSVYDDQGQLLYRGQLESQNDKISSLTRQLEAALEHCEDRVSVRTMTIKEKFSALRKKIRGLQSMLYREKVKNSRLKKSLATYPVSRKKIELEIGEVCAQSRLFKEFMTSQFRRHSHIKEGTRRQPFYTNIELEIGAIMLQAAGSKGYG